MQSNLNLKAWANEGMIYLIVTFKPKINLIFEDWHSLGIFLGLFVAFIWWITSIHHTQRKILKHVQSHVTKAEMDTEFARLRLEIKEGK